MHLHFEEFADLTKSTVHGLLALHQQRGIMESSGFCRRLCRWFFLEENCSDNGLAAQKIRHENKTISEPVFGSTDTQFSVQSIRGSNARPFQLFCRSDRVDGSCQTGVDRAAWAVGLWGVVNPIQVQRSK
jgi:hypothetical protein